MTNVSGGGLTLAWIDGRNGDWTNGANWRTAPTGAPGVPTASDTAVLGGTQSYTVTISKTDQATANALSWTNAQATLVVSGALTLNDGPQSDAGTMVIQGGSLNLALPSSGGTASLDYETIDLSDGAISAQVANSPSTSGMAALTLGGGLTLVQVAGTSNSVNLNVGGSPVVSNSLTNKGIIQAGVAGGRFQVSVQAAPSTGGGPFYGLFDNSGTIDVANGELFDASNTNFDNTGHVNIGSGSTAVFGIQSWDNFGATASITVGHGATLTLRGDYSDAANIINNGGTVILEGVPANFADITASGGTLVLDPSYLIPPTIFSPPGTPPRGGVIARGHLYIDSGATLHLRGDPSSGYVTSDLVTFNGTGGTLALDAPGDLVGQVNGATVGVVFDLVSAGFDSSASAALNVGNVLQMTAGGQTYLLQLNPSEIFDGVTVAAAPDTSGGTAFTLVGVPVTSTVTVASGITSAGLLVPSGERLSVLSGGTISNTAIVAGGQSRISAGGLASNTAVSSDGLDTVLGLDKGTTVSNGGRLNVSSGGSAVGDLLLGGTLDVLSGGVASGTTVSSGAIFVSGTASGTHVAAGGTELILLGGVNVAAVVASGGNEVIFAGGTASGTVVSGGGEIDSGRAVSTSQLAGSWMSVASGGVASATTVSNSVLFVSGTASGTQLKHGTELVSSGGMDFGATASGDSTFIISASGTASGTTLSGGGEIAAGSAVSTSLLGGSWMSVASGGVASGTTVSNSILFASGTASGTQLNHGTEVVSSGAMDFAAAASGDSTFVVSGGGTASGTVVSSSGEIDAGSAVDTSLLGGSWMSVASGGVASGTTVSNSILFVSGTASGTQLNHGTEVVSSGATDFEAAASGDSTFVVSAGGTASGTILSGAGELDAGSAVSTSLLGGSWMSVQSGGIAIGTTVSNSILFVSGTASATQLNSGIAFVQSGGVDIGANINSSGFEVVSSGGTASSAVISGGTLEVASSGSTGTGATTFAVSGGGILQLDDSQHFGGLVAGFGQPDLLDLRDIAFTSATTLSWTQVTSGASASGTLTVSGGGNVANITLLGHYVASQFTSASDGQGGTLVGDPPVGVVSNTLAAHNT
jgi:fibronectin-binding autotransporter adhesin